jgi:predicted nucleic-acid-binding protein
VRYLIDTNVVLRFLRDDHKAHSPAAKALFERAAAGECTLVVTDLIIAEAVWVLVSFYKAKRVDVADALAGIINQPGIECAGQPMILDALERFRATKLDFADCYLIARSATTGHAIASFDSDFGKIKGVRWVRPVD